MSQFNPLKFKVIFAFVLRIDFGFYLLPENWTQHWVFACENLVISTKSVNGKFTQLLRTHINFRLVTAMIVIK